MNRKELLRLIEGGEGLRTEFKRKFSTFEKIAKELIAFANTKGGVLIIGVDDNGKIYGVESEKGETELVKEAAERYCEPPVDISIQYFDVENKELVVVTVPESEYKPHRVQDYLPEIEPNTAHVYVRVRDKSVLASKEMIKILQARAKRLTLKHYEIGKIEKIVFEYLEDHESITVKELKQKANVSYRRASRALIKLVRANLLMIHTKENGEDYFTYF
jgi:predicted HTH transcriptional regulator